MKKNRSGGKALMVIGVLLLLAAAALTVFNRSREMGAGQQSDAALRDLSAVIKESAEEKKTEESAPREELPEETEEAALPEEARTMPTVEMDGALYVGVLQIPALGLELPIINDWSNSNLYISPCRYTGSVNSGDLVIAGHNYDTHFGRLPNLTAGDDIYFVTVDGESYHYQVTSFETLEPTAVEYMTEGEYPLTLFTCTWGGRTRYTVRCDLRPE